VLIIIHYLATEAFCLSTAHCYQSQTFQKMLCFFESLSSFFCIFNFAAFLSKEGLYPYPQFPERYFDAKKRKSTFEKSKDDK